MGYGSYIGPNSIVKYTKIGKFNSISWNVSIGGSNHNYNSASMYTSYWWKKVFNVNFFDEKTGLESTIGNGTWIGAGVNIIRGVTIGDGAVIGAGAVITEDVPPFAIVTGVPGKIKKYRFNKETIKVLLETKWWDWPAEVIQANAEILHANISQNSLKKILDISHSIKE